MSTFAELLQNNPIFQLSLSSKELFHSNFLAWLAEDKNTRRLFNRLMQDWLNDPDWEFDDEKMMVKREYKNFDFCICQKVRNYHTDKEKDEEPESKFIPGAIIFVLENKFKSLPYKEQLQKYHEKVLQLNIQGLKDEEKAETNTKRLENNWIKKNKVIIDAQNSKTKYVLLTLADNLLDNTNDENSPSLSFTTSKTVTYDKTDFTNNADWKIIKYKQYSKVLSQINEKESSWNGVENKTFYQELIRKYCEFIKTFSEHIASCLNEIGNENGKDTIKKDTCWNILTNHQEFYEIRCYDIWQKLVMHKCAKHLVSLLDSNITIDYNSSDKHIWEESYQGKKLYMGIGFFHGEAFLELKYLMPNNAVFCLQQQGNNTLNVGLVLHDKKIKKKSEEAWNAKVIEEIGSLFPGHIDCSDKKFYSYQGEHYSFFYYHLQEEEVSLLEAETKNTVKGEKNLSVNRTLEKMKDLMNKTVERK